MRSSNHVSLDLLEGLARPFEGIRPIIRVLLTSIAWRAASGG